MADRNRSNWRNIALGIMAAIVVLLVVLWLADVFETTTEQPVVQEPEAVIPEPEAE